MRAVAPMMAAVLVLSACGEQTSTHATSDSAHEAAHDHAHSLAAAPQPLPGSSIYQLEGFWTDQNADQVSLDVFRGSPVVVVMFYGTCQHACPILVHDVQRLEAALPEDERERLRVVLVTFDPERDSPQRLAAYASEHELASERWRLLHGTDLQIRELAAVLGVRYRDLGNGDFSHSMLITLLDPRGVVVERVEGLQQPVDGLVRHVGALLKPKA